MATFHEHSEDCRRELGDPFEKVHAWLDELQSEYGPMHRRFRHHTEGVERVRSKWGDAAAEAAAIHIRKDCGGVIPSQSRYSEHWDNAEEELEPDGMR